MQPQPAIWLVAVHDSGERCRVFVRLVWRQRVRDAQKRRCYEVVVLGEQTILRDRRDVVVTSLSVRFVVECFDRPPAVDVKVGAGWIEPRVMECHLPRVLGGPPQQRIGIGRGGENDRRVDRELAGLQRSKYFRQRIAGRMWLRPSRVVPFRSRELPRQSACQMARSSSLTREASHS